MRTKSGILLIDWGGFDVPSTCVKVNPTSKDIYVVATKNATESTEKGWGGGELAVRRKMESRRTTIELRVPSSTICVATMALASNAQNNVATRPAWMAVSATKAVEPWVSKEPDVINWNGRVKRYKTKNIRSSIRPVI